MTSRFQPRRAIEQLGPAHYDPVKPADFPQLILRFRNQRWAERIGLGGLDETGWLEHFGRFALLPGSLPQPLALRYHGHQFRTYNPDLGDGRGFLFAQLAEPDTGRLLDLGTKGSGQTPWSRFGDGRLTLKGGVREVLATEMLEALGVNTSKSFSLIETGEALQRNDEPSPTRASVLVRLSHSHIRIGMVQRLAYLDQPQEMRRLIDYVLEHLFNLGTAGSEDEKVARFLDKVVANAASLAAGYMAAGFVHGVLNTDNINLTGESFDYGPYRFAPLYDPAFTAAYFDHGGLYAFGRQAEALHWNVYQLAKALLVIAPQEVLIPALETFPPRFEVALVAAICARLGVRPHADSARNQALLAAIEQGLSATQLSLDRFYFDWYGGPMAAGRLARSPARQSYDSAPFQALREQILDFVPAPGVAARLASSYFAGDAPCALLIDEIEAIWAAIDSQDDWAPFERKIARIRAMGDALGPAVDAAAASR